MVTYWVIKCSFITVPSKHHKGTIFSNENNCIFVVSELHSELYDISRKSILCNLEILFKTLSYPIRKSQKDSHIPKELIKT